MILLTWTAGRLVTAAQLGYALGVLLIVPLGDMRVVSVAIPARVS